MFPRLQKRLLRQHRNEKLRSWRISLDLDFPSLSSGHYEYITDRGIRQGATASVKKGSSSIPPKLLKPGRHFQNWMKGSVNNTLVGTVTSSETGGIGTGFHSPKVTAAHSASTSTLG